jgi:hypothetical protein
MAQQMKKFKSQQNPPTKRQKRIQVEDAEEIARRQFFTQYLSKEAEDQLVLKKAPQIAEWDSEIRKLEEEKLKMDRDPKAKLEEKITTGNRIEEELREIHKKRDPVAKQYRDVQDKFAEQRNFANSFAMSGPPKRKLFMDRVQKLKRELVTQFAKSYLAQNKNSELFFQNFIEQPAVAAEISSKDLGKGLSQDVGALKTKYKEEKERRNFFERVQDITDKIDFSTEYVTFSNEGDEERQIFLSKLMMLNTSLNKKYIEGFLAQQTKTSEQYFREFIKRPDVVEKVKHLGLKADTDIFEQLEEKERHEEEAEFRARFEGADMEGEAFEGDEEAREWIYGDDTGAYMEGPRQPLIIDGTPTERWIPDKGPNKGKLISMTFGAKYPREPIFIYTEGPGGEQIPFVPKEDVTKEKTKMMPDAMCLSLQQRVAWMEHPSVKQIWITNPPNLGVEEKYVHKNESVTKDDLIWYKANKKYLELQCDNRSNKRKQNGNILTCYNDNDEPVRFMVGYEMVNKTFVYQDEAVFEKQLNFFKRRNMSVNDSITEILSQPVSETARQVGKEKMERELLPVVNDEEYVKQVEQHIYNKSHATSRAYFEDIVNITNFLESWTAAYPTFRERLAGKYYKPAILGQLTIEEKLPEIFDNPAVSVLDQSRAFAVLSSEEHIVRDMAYSVYKRLNPTRSHRTGLVPAMPTGLGIKAPERPCEQKDLFTGIPEKDLVYYEDVGGRTFCFSIPQLLEQFAKEDYENMYTHQPFDEKFVTKIKHYSTDIIEEDSGKALADLMQEENIAPGLLDKVRVDLKRLQQNMIDDYEGEDFFAEDTDPKRAKQQEHVCEYCNKYVNPDSGYRTILKDGKNYRVVDFCSTNCFAQVDWPDSDSDSDSDLSSDDESNKGDGVDMVDMVDMASIEAQEQNIEQGGTIPEVPLTPSPKPDDVVTVQYMTKGQPKTKERAKVSPFLISRTTTRAEAEKIPGGIIGKESAEEARKREARKKLKAIFGDDEEFSEEEESDADDTSTTTEDSDDNE